MGSTGRASKEDWADRVAAKVAAAQEVLAEQVAALRSGEDWKRFLDFQARLHAYSPGNCMLIQVAHALAFAAGAVPTPEPTYVAGFNTWKALGRSVDKGQHGYAILAPMTGHRRVAVDGQGQVRPLGTEDGARSGEIEERRRQLFGFKVEYCFEVGQTSGEPVPEPTRPKLLEGEAPPGLGVAVLRLIESRGFTVDTVPDARAIQGANGQTTWATRSVVVRADMDDAAMVKTLIHEAAHCLLHEDPAGQLVPRSLQEVEAESVAYVVASAHGMPTDEYTFPYVAGWAGEDPNAAVLATQRRVAQAAKTIIEVSPAEHSSGGKVPGADQALEAARARRAELTGGFSAAEEPAVAVVGP